MFLKEMEYDRIYMIVKIGWIEETRCDEMHDNSNFIMITYLDAHFKIDSTIDDMHEKINYNVWIK